MIEKLSETVVELEKAVIDEWWDIDKSVVQHEIEHVVENFIKCIEREGGRTNKSRGVKN